MITLRIHALFFGATAMLAASGALASDPIAVERGATLADQWCSACHATSTSAKGADVGPAFQNIAAQRSPAHIRGFLAKPHVDGAMAFDLSGQQIEDLIAYLDTLR